jgi:serine phosphatase RsbU (regulator of sigma subunit)
VLGELHRGLLVLLGQDQGEGETDDGLEAGVCFVSEAERRLVFSGARFSLWRANGGAVDEIKGDKAGIGYRRFAHDTHFSDVPVDLANGAAFYLTTDGLIDQVGGPRHRSFGKKRFRAFVAAHQGRPMPEQAEALRQTLAAYQGEQVRRDDVTVLGFVPNAA